VARRAGLQTERSRSPSLDPRRRTGKGINGGTGGQQLATEGPGGDEQDRGQWFTAALSVGSPARDMQIVCQEFHRAAVVSRLWHGSLPYMTAAKPNHGPARTCFGDPPKSSSRASGAADE
jgi:hypothetical protein